MAHSQLTDAKRIQLKKWLLSERVRYFVLSSAVFRWPRLSRGVPSCPPAVERLSWLVCSMVCFHNYDSHWHQYSKPSILQVAWFFWHLLSLCRHSILFQNPSLELCLLLPFTLWSNITRLCQCGGDEVITAQCHHNINIFLNIDFIGSFQRNWVGSILYYIPLLFINQYGVRNPYWRPNALVDTCLWSYPVEIHF